MTCDYAACTLPGVIAEQGWRFCPGHYREHRADLHGEQWPTLRESSVQAFIRRRTPVPPLPALYETCGSPSWYASDRRHYRAGETCEACRAHGNAYRQSLRTPSDSRPQVWAAISRLTEQGLSTREVAARLRVSPRTVTRARARAAA